MTLSQMKENDFGHISYINTEPSFLRRFYDLGFMEGQCIRCENIGLLGTPIAYQIRGSKIALRKCDADKIGVVL